MLYKVVAGDYSDDGHGKTYTGLYDIAGDFTHEQLNKNFATNVAEFVNPFEIANEYEDCSIDSDVAKKLEAAGFTGVEYDIYDKTYAIFGSGISELVVWLTCLGITTYKKVREEVPELVGWRGILENPEPDSYNSSVGYGCFL